MNEKTSRNYMEIIVSIAIVLVVIQTMLEDWLVMTNAPWSIRKSMIYASFIFDLFFTMEFLLRSWNAMTQKKLRKYFLYESGWIDFLASIPLLLFNSTPELISTVMGSPYVISFGSFLGILKIIKIIRIARFLKLLRLIKIFKRIRFAESAMVQRHMVRVVTTIAISLIFAQMLLTFVFSLINFKGMEEVWAGEQLSVPNLLDTKPEWMSDPEFINEWGDSQPSIMLIKNNDSTVYTKYDNDYFKKYMGIKDFRMVVIEPYRVWIDTRPQYVTDARFSLKFTLSLIVVIVIVILSYSTHFAISLSDPINVMLRGFSETGYNNEVKVIPRYEHDEIFKLAQAFNEEYLPMKALHHNDGQLDMLSVDELKDIL